MKTTKPHIHTFTKLQPYNLTILKFNYYLLTNNVNTRDPIES